MKCPRCKNTDKKYFYQLNNRYYCRKCIPFQRIFIDDLLEKRIEKTESKPVSYHLSFYLSQRQQVISDKLADNFRQHKNSLVLAVCGSGKTEMCFEVIISRESVLQFLVLLLRKSFIRDLKNVLKV